MNHTMRRRLFLAETGWVLAGAGLALSGCGLRKPSMPSRTFVLKGPASTPKEALGAAGILLVRPFKVGAAFDSRAFVIRRGESEYVPDAYHAFLVSPGAMLTDLVAEYIRGLGKFSVVTTGGSQVVPSHVLEADVTEISGDYRDLGSPKAVLAIQFRMLHPLTEVRPPFLWQIAARQEVPIVRPEPEALVAGWEEGLARFCDRMAHVLGMHEQARPESGA